VVATVVLLICLVSRELRALLALTIGSVVVMARVVPYAYVAACVAAFVDYILV